MTRIAGAAASLVLLAAACQATPAPSGTGSGGPAATSAGAASQPAGSGPGVSASPDLSGLIQGEGDLFLDPLFAMESLTSHEATLTWHFAGTVDGQPSEWTETTTLRTATQPAMAELIVERTNVPDQPARSWTALTDGTIFETVGDGACSGSSRRLVGTCSSSPPRSCQG